MRTHWEQTHRTHPHPTGDVGEIGVLWPPERLSRRADGSYHLERLDTGEVTTINPFQAAAWLYIQGYPFPPDLREAGKAVINSPENQQLLALSGRPSSRS